MEQLISSPQNPRVKSVARLHERSERRERKLCVVEGEAEVMTALASGIRCETLYWCEESIRGGSRDILGLAASRGIETCRVSQPAMARMAWREHADAWLAVVALPETDLDTFARRSLPGSKEAGLYVLAEDAEKPGNLGAVLRSADAAGAHGFLAVDSRTDMGNANIIRASKSAVFTMPCAEAGGHEALAWCRAQGLRILAATPSATRDYWDVDMSLPTVIAVGAEKEGLSDFWMDQADERVLIPMKGQVNSLNLAQAATLLLYEAARQRRSKL